MATTNDLKNGMVLNLDGQLWQVIWFQHHKPGKGGAVVRSKLKNVESGKTVDKTFNADVKVEVANVDKRTMQYLYNDGTSYVFMDNATFEQTEVSPAALGDAVGFLLENQDAVVATNDGRVLYVELPASVKEATLTLSVWDAEVYVNGQLAARRWFPLSAMGPRSIDLARHLRPGRNVIAIHELR